MSLHAGSVVADFKIDDRAFRAALVNAQREIEKSVTKASTASSKSIDGLRIKAKQLEDQLNKSQIGSKAFNNLAASLRGVNKELAKADSLAKGGSGIFSTSSMSNLARSLPLVGVGLAGVAAGLAAITKNALMAGAELEQTKTAFSVYLGGGEQGAAAASAFVDQLNRIADVTPFTNQEIISTGKLLLSFGQSTEQVKENLQILGDVAAGTNQPIEGLGRILGQVQAKGRLQSEELMQFMERGINLIPELEKVTGKGGAALQKMISSGQIGFDTFRQALKGMTQQGGLFFQMMEKQSKTFSGLLSTIEGKTQNFMATLGEGAAEGLKPLLEDIVAEQEEMANNSHIWKQNIKEAADSFVKLAREIKRPFSDIKKMFSGIKTDFSFINAAMFTFGLAIRTAIGPFSLLIDGFVLLKALIQSIADKDMKNFDTTLAEIEKKWGEQNKTMKEDWDKIWNPGPDKPNVKIEIDVNGLKNDISKGMEEGGKEGKEKVEKYIEGTAIEWGKEINTIIADELDKEFEVEVKVKTVASAGGGTRSFGGGIGDMIGNANSSVGNMMGQMMPMIGAISKAMDAVFGELNKAIDAYSKLLAAKFELASVKIQNQLRLIDFFGEIELRKFREQKQQEIEEFERAEDAKIEKLRQVQREREEILNEELRLQREQMDADLQAKLALLDVEFQAKLAYLDMEAADFEQRQVLKEIADEDRKKREREIVDEHNKELENKDSESNKRKEKDKRDSDAAIEAAEKQKQENIEKMQKEATAAEKKRAKEIANMKWILELNQFILEKEFRKKQIMLEAAQAYMAAVQSAFSAGPFGLALLPGYLSLIRSTTAAANAAVDAQLPPLPPSENFAQGGLVTGPGTSTSDSIPANLSNGEFVMNARATAANLPALEAMNAGMSPGVVVNFGTHAVVVIGDIDPRAQAAIGAMVAQEVTKQQGQIFHRRFTQ